MSPINDGGQTALAGYFYQTLGVLGVKAMAHTIPESTRSTEFEALLHLIRDGELDFEQLGQDAVIYSHDLGVEPSDSCVLVQFKFSQTPSSHPLGVTELREIVVRLEESGSGAQARGLKVSGTAIITNRGLTSHAEDFVRNPVLEHRYAGELTETQLEVLNSTRIRQRVDLSIWEDALARFAARYGAIDRDVQGGIRGLVGDLFSNTAQGTDRTITRDDLIRAFTGVGAAQPLTAERVISKTAGDIRKSRNQFGARRQPIRRERLEELGRAASQRALVVLEGEGGTGKTVALWEWAKDVVDTVPSGSGAFTEVARPCLQTYNQIRIQAKVSRA